MPRRQQFLPPLLLLLFALTLAGSTALHAASPAPVPPDGVIRWRTDLAFAADIFSGHATTATPRIPDLVFRHYPLRFGLFGDSLHVTHATAADRELLAGGWCAWENGRRGRSGPRSSP